jgi:hypothetical protein
VGTNLIFHRGLNLATEGNDRKKELKMNHIDTNSRVSKIEELVCI